MFYKIYDYICMLTRFAIINTQIAKASNLMILKFYNTRDYKCPDESQPMYVHIYLNV